MVACIRELAQAHRIQDIETESDLLLMSHDICPRTPW